MTLRDQTFDTFVIGQSNRFAHAAAIAVAESLAKAYNPLYIWGEAGLGKTHLLRAIARYAKGLNPKTEIEYLSGATVRRDFTTIRRGGRAQEDFENRYGCVDLLLIDDVHRLIGSDAAQKGLLERLEPLVGGGTQVVLTSDRSTRAFSALRDIHLMTDWSLVIDLTPPDMDMRLAILRQQDRITMSEVDLRDLARNSGPNIGALLETYDLVYDYATTVGEPVSIDLVRQALGEE